MAEEREDWLFPDAQQQRKDLAAKGLAFAQKYLIFVRDPDAAALLAQWTDMVRKKPILPGASVQEYAAANALREFIEGIHAQIQTAAGRP